MQINGYSNLTPLPSSRNGTTSNNVNTSSPASSDDQAVISTSGDNFTSLVSAAQQIPDVRTDLVESFKSRIAAGEYPTAGTNDALVSALGSHIVKLASYPSAS